MFFSASPTKFITPPTPPKLPRYIIHSTTLLDKIPRPDYIGYTHARSVDNGDNNTSYGNTVGKSVSTTPPMTPTRMHELCVGSPH